MSSKKTVKIGDIEIGGNNKVAIQSMLNVHATRVEESVEQAVELEKIGCDIIRAAIPTMESVEL
ncbi:MAG: flavodoxin-dependent (E)-4-hydroxy-3-methylbut-2-enyl-diphosphate synthase, partial [Oscillospiraceae bacterium]